MSSRKRESKRKIIERKFQQLHVLLMIVCLLFRPIKASSLLRLGSNGLRERGKSCGKSAPGIKTFRVRRSFRRFRESCMQIGRLAAPRHRRSSLFPVRFLRSRGIRERKQLALRTTSLGPLTRLSLEEEDEGEKNTPRSLFRGFEASEAETHAIRSLSAHWHPAERLFKVKLSMFSDETVCDRVSSRVS